MIVWLNGTLLPLSAARIDPTDRGFTLADGVFESLRCEGGTILRLDRHLARLRDGAALLGIPLGLSDAALTDALHATRTANGLTDASLRLELTRGPAPRGVRPPAEPAPTLLITAGPAPAAPPGPARLVTATVTRRNEHSPLCRVKHLAYGDNILALKEAVAQGADDAILLNTAGRVAETTYSNLFLEVDGDWITPPLADGALPGTHRAELLEAGAAVEAPVTTAMLGRARRAFLTNSGGRRPVAAVDGRALET